MGQFGIYHLAGNVSEWTKDATSLEESNPSPITLTKIQSKKRKLDNPKFEEDVTRESTRVQTTKQFSQDFKERVSGVLLLPNNIMKILDCVVCYQQPLTLTNLKLIFGILVLTFGINKGLI